MLDPSPRLVPQQLRLDCIAAALVVICFCIPLFVGLGGRDLGNDEAIYSYSVLRIVETGEWLTPRAIPFDGPFLEKPPLKFWMAAAPIAAGLLPADELGLRAVDALLGALAFLYVFLLGRWLSGPVAGVASVLLLYSLDPVVLALRSNTMEAALVLAYAGGVYHFARWTDGRGAASLAWHRWAVALYFVLGFLSKFVAVLFLPLICVAAISMSHDSRAFLRATWRAWLGPAALVVVLSVPWFAYQAAVNGRLVWDVMFGQHVYTRFTGALDATHLHPWHFYISTLWRRQQDADWNWLALAGMVALGIRAGKRDGWLARVFLFWSIVPIGLVSLGSSKLFHYIYPFLPAVALGGGYATAVVFDAANSLLGTGVLTRIRQRLPNPAAVGHGGARGLRGALIAAAALAALTALITAINGGVSWELDERELFRNTSLTRPLLIAGVLLFAAGELQWASRSLAATLLVFILPVASYSSSLSRPGMVNSPLRAARDCMIEVRRSGEAGDTLYNAASTLTDHSYNYYFRAFEPWARVERPDPVELRRRLVEPGSQSPVLISDADYVRFALPAADGDAGEWSILTGFSADPGLIVLLPGAYATCAADAARAGGRPVGFVAGAELWP